VRGRVKALFPSFGFINDDATALDFFFHRDDVVGAIDFEQLQVGDSVTYEAVDPVPPKGRRAQQVAFITAGARS
jgi:cold shock CspA family protein